MRHLVTVRLAGVIAGNDTIPDELEVCARTAPHRARARRQRSEDLARAGRRIE